jgi:hypothetical protein
MTRGHQAKPGRKKAPRQRTVLPAHHSRIQWEHMTMTFPDRAGPAADSDQSQELRPEDIAYRRCLCTWLQYWRDCATPGCRRSHRCVGDPTDCYIRHYMSLSDVGRVWVRARISALDRGLTARNAAGAADLMLLHHVKKADRLPRHPPRCRRELRIEGEGGAKTTRARSAGSPR